MAITDWPEAERPREKLLAQGATQLSDGELLAIFLRVGVKGKNAIQLAEEMLRVHGGLRGLLAASHDAFCQVPGLGTAKYVQLQAVLELSRRYFAEAMQRGEALTSAVLTKQYLARQLRPLSHEVFAALFLDNQHRIIVYEELFHGTIDCAAVYPREVLRRVLHHHAAAVIFAHNHPSGAVQPSPADVQLTERLRQALHLIDVRLLDHCIVGDTAVFSFAEAGLL